MKELNYSKSASNEMKIKHAKRKTGLARLILGIFLAFFTLGFANAEKPNQVKIASEISLAGVAGAFMFKTDSKFDDFLKHKGIEGGEKGEAFKALDAEAAAGYFIEYNEGMRKAISDAIAQNATKEEIQQLKNELSEQTQKQLDALNGILKQQGIMLKRLSTEEIEAREKSIEQHLKENIDKLKTLKNGMKSEAAGATFDFVIHKAVADMTRANISGGNVPVEDRLEGFNIIPSRKVRFLEVLSKRKTDSNIVSWVYQANKDGAAGQTAEGATKNQIDFDLVVDNESLKKTTAFIKVSTEMLDDVSWIRSEIDAELMRELLKKVEVQAYSGDDTGQNLNGIRTVATAFSAAAGLGAESVDNANSVDVLVSAMLQIEVAEQEDANFIFMHPKDVALMKVYKVSTTDRRYVDRLLLVGSSLTLDGVPIIKTTLVTAGTYLVGNFTLAMLVEAAAGIRIEIGLDGNDFTKNMRTILAEWRGLTLVKNNDRTAFVKGTFATDIEALAVPAA